MKDEMSKERSKMAKQPYPDDNPKTIMGMAKPPLSAIPPTAIMHLGMVMDNGRKKYGHMNWRHKKVTSSVYYDALMRHAMSWLDGEKVDADSGCHPLAHVMACCAIIIDADSVGMLNDDRPKPGNYPVELKLRTTNFVVNSGSVRDFGEE